MFRYALVLFLALFDLSFGQSITWSQNTQFSGTTQKVRRLGAVYGVGKSDNTCEFRLAATTGEITTMSLISLSPSVSLCVDFEFQTLLQGDTPVTALIVANRTHLSTYSLSSTTFTLISSVLLPFQNGNKGSLVVDQYYGFLYLVSDSGAHRVDISNLRNLTLQSSTRFDTTVSLVGPKSAILLGKTVFFTHRVSATAPSTANSTIHAVDVTDSSLGTRRTIATRVPPVKYIYSSGFFLYLVHENTASVSLSVMNPDNGVIIKSFGFTALNRTTFNDVAISDNIMLSITSSPYRFQAYRLSGDGFSLSLIANRSLSIPSVPLELFWQGSEALLGREISIAATNRILTTNFENVALAFGLDPLSAPLPYGVLKNPWAIALPDKAQLKAEANVANILFNAIITTKRDTYQFLKFVLRAAEWDSAYYTVSLKSDGTSLDNNTATVLSFPAGTSLKVDLEMKIKKMYPQDRNDTLVFTLQCGPHTVQSSPMLLQYVAIKPEPPTIPPPSIWETLWFYMTNYLPWTITAGVVLFFVLLSLVFCCCWWRRREKKKNQKLPAGVYSTANTYNGMWWLQPQENRA